MSALQRLAVDAACPSCGRPNVVLLPEAACGNEFVWHARCGGCGAWRWFHAREDREFVRAIKEAAKRRGEPGGLTSEGTLEAHAAFEATLDPCGCGDRFRVVRTLEELPCLGCGTEFGKTLPTVDAKTVDVPSLRP